MKKITAIVAALWLLTSGVGIIASERAVNNKPGTLSSPVSIKPIDKQILDDQAKLGKTLPVDTRNKLGTITRQLLLRMPKLQPRANIRNVAMQEVQKAFPGVTSQPELDSLVFWVVTETAKGAQQDFQELLAQKTLAENRQRQINEMLVMVRKRLGNDKPRQTNTTKPASRKKLPQRFTRNMQIPLPQTPELICKTRDIETASPEVLADIQRKLDSAAEDTQLTMIDLQKIYQDFQQAVQTLSGIIKQTHDDAMKIISNMKS